MPSLGEVRISVNNCHDAIILTVLDVVADQAKYPRLIINARYILKETDDTSYPLQNYELTDLRGELRLSEHSDAIGTVVWIGQRHQYKSNLTISEGFNVKLYCDLDPRRIEKIEQHRNGQEPVFWIELWPTLIGEKNFTNIQTRPCRIAIPRDRWIQILKGTGYGDFEIIEIVRGRMDEKLYSRAITHIKDAQTRLNYGDYDGCLADCRESIEAIIKATPKEEGNLDVAFKATLVEKLGKKRADHLIGIISRVKKWTNIAAHSQEQPVEHSRAEAQFIMNSTINILYLIGG
jgi:hypothetical protein